MDQPDVDAALLAEDLRNLEALNRFFGGRSAVLAPLRRVLAEARPRDALRVLDVGSGAGDLCRVVVEACREVKVPVRLWSLDFHPRTQAYARRGCRGYPEIAFVRGDARDLPIADGSVDVALCTLALHHFTEPDARRVLSELRRVSRGWAIVSDLCRSRAALAGVWLVSRLTRNRMTRHDAVVSVQRAFDRSELERLAQDAGWVSAEFQPQAWFRMAITQRVAPGGSTT
jgi:SAM-dependent methyltransferase